VPLYIIDTSIWIRLWQNHPPDIFRNLWQQIDGSITAGQILSPEEVLHELERGMDDLAERMRARDGLFAPLDQALQDAVRRVIIRCPGLADENAERNRADPFVVALAELSECAVVTMEKPRRTPNARPKIPDACWMMGIPCIDWFGYLRASGYQL
jgi:hypothetical protein